MKKISIIILFYNGERFYQDCLSSLRNALTGDEEVLLIDNNSKDSTCKLIECDFRKQKVRVHLRSSSCSFIFASWACLNFLTET